jgi:asparagine synthase (glutamine-hydrolysing)
MGAIWGIHRSDRELVSPRLIARMGDALAWLGDAEPEEWSGPRCGLGARRFIGARAESDRTSQYRRRLSDGELIVAADARIDHRDDLIARCGIDPRSAREATSEDLIRAVVRSRGIEGLELLEGDFTFVLYDRREERLVCMQSPYPSQPLYYFQQSGSFQQSSSLEQGGFFAFATRVAAFFEVEGFEKRLDVVEFAARLVPGLARLAPDRTCFQGVRALPAGHILIVDARGEVTVRRWWPTADSFPIDRSLDRDWAEGLRATISTAVRDRIQGLDPVACFLSGGLDSSTISGIARGITRADGIRAFGVASVLGSDAIAAGWRDEREFIDLAAQRFDLDIVRVTPPDHPSPFEILPVVFDAVEHPIGFREYLYAALFGAVRGGGATHVLDGVGGELGPSHFGRGYYARLAAQGSWVRLLRELRAYAARREASIARMLYREILAPFVRTAKLRWGWAAKGAAGRVLADLPLRAGDFPRSGIEPRLEEYTSSQRRWGGTLDLRADLEWAARRFQWPTNEFAARFGVRSLFPFLDARVMQASASILAHAAREDGWRRLPIRRAAEGILPPEIQWRSSKGPFSPDYARRVCGSLDDARAILESARSGEAGEMLDLDLIGRWIEEMRMDEKRSDPSRRARANASTRPRNGNLDSGDEGPAGRESQKVKRLHRAIIGVAYLDWFESFGTRAGSRSSSSHLAQIEISRTAPA